MIVGAEGNGDIMEKYELITWIRHEMTSTTTCLSEEVIGYERSLMPNPEMYCSEFTDYPTTPDRQHIIVDRPVCGTVARIVLDEQHALRAAEVLVNLILHDERYIYLAEELMENRTVFARHWEYLCLHGKNERTIHTALFYLGRTPGQLIVKSAGKIGAKMQCPIIEFAGKLIAVVCIYGTIIYVIWPDSKLGRSICRAIKIIITEARKIIYG